MAGDVGSQVAAQDILSFVLKEMDAHKDEPEVMAVLQRVADKAKDIVEASKSGWY